MPNTIEDANIGHWAILGSCRQWIVAAGGWVKNKKALVH